MRAMILPALCRLDENPNPLQLAELPVPEPGPGEILVRVAACGVCHTELDEIEGRTPPPRLPVILGHQVVGGWRRWVRARAAFTWAARGGGMDLLGVRDVRVLPLGPGEPLPGVPGDGPRRARRLCRADGRAGAVRLSHPRFSPTPGGAAAVRRRHRLPVAAAERLAGRAEPRVDRLRRIGAPGAEDGAAPLSAQPRLCLLAHARRSRPLPGSWAPLGRRHDGHRAGAAALHHRHHAGLEAGGGGAAQPGARAAGW